MVRNERSRRYALSYGSVRPHYTAQRCPRCSRRFEKATSVLKHLNHPRSKCAQAWFPEQQPKPPFPIELSVDGWEDVVDTGPFETIIENDETPSDGTPQTHYSEKFPGASQTFGHGRTFMDRFDSDPFAPERKDNIYYPFSSESEWELASFLQRSCLSMKSIDEFLALKLVS